MHADPSYFFSGDGYQCLFLRLPSVQSLFFAPNIGLVDLYAAAEPFAARPHHRAPQLVQQRGGALASQTQNALQIPEHSPRFSGSSPTIARYQVRSGRRVSWKIVPAVTEARTVRSAAGPADCGEFAALHSGDT